MRLLEKVPVAAAACAAAAVLLTGCAAAEQAQTCVEAPKVISETVSKVGAVVNDPAAMRKELEKGADKLNDLANAAGDTTLKEALQGMANTLEGVSVKDANAAVDTAQKVATDSVSYLKKVSEACGL